MQRNKMKRIKITHTNKKTEGTQKKSRYPFIEETENWENKERDAKWVTDLLGSFSSCFSCAPLYRYT